MMKIVMSDSSSIVTYLIEYDSSTRIHHFTLVFSGEVSCGMIPHYFRWLLNLILRYSSPWSDHSALILCLIRNTYPLLKSSENIINYEYPPLALVPIGPHTSVCTRAKSSMALSFTLLKDILVIFLSKQDSCRSIDSQSNWPKNPSSWSFLMYFLFIWPKWQCHIRLKLLLLILSRLVLMLYMNVPISIIYRPFTKED
jgi:hypothetical protein